MKRISFVDAALLAVGGFVTPRAEAEICLDFVGFVDGLELNISGDVITGFWRNWDGRGSDAPIQGLIKDVQVYPCHQGPSFQLPDPQSPPKAFVTCMPELGCVTGDPDDDWYFFLDGLDGTLDVGWDIGGDSPPGACPNDDLEYVILLGPCLFGPQSGLPSIASARRGKD